MAYTKEKFEKMLYSIADDYVLVRSKYELYCKMIELSETQTKLMNDISPGFFTLVFNAMISDIFINLTKLIDHKEESVGTIYTLILDSYHSKSLFSNKHNISYKIKSNHQSELRKLGKTLSKVQYVRNKRFAHLDPRYQLDRDKIIEDKSITFNDLKEVFDVLHNVINHYYTSFFGIDLTPYADNAKDVINLMEILSVYQDEEMNVFLLGSGLKPSKKGIPIDEI